MRGSVPGYGHCVRLSLGRSHHRLTAPDNLVKRLGDSATGSLWLGHLDPCDACQVRSFMPLNGRAVCSRQNLVHFGSTRRSCQKMDVLTQAPVTGRRRSPELGGGRPGILCSSPAPPGLARDPPDCRYSQGSPRSSPRLPLDLGCIFAQFLFVETHFARYRLAPAGSDTGDAVWFKPADRWRHWMVGRRQAIAGHRADGLSSARLDERQNDQKARAGRWHGQAQEAFMDQLRTPGYDAYC